MYILGINSAYHESSVCLLKNGVVIAAIEEERFNRIKHAKPASIETPHVLPLNSLKFLLDQEKINLGDIEYIGYSFNPYERLKNINLEENIIPDSWGTKIGEELFFHNLIKIPEVLNKQGFSGNFVWLNHHDCHAASAFFVTYYKEAAVLSIDGIGETDSTVIYHGKDNHLNKLKSFSYPNSLGFLWEKISQFLGFTEYDASKVMGLCAYGNPKNFNDIFFNSIVHVEDETFSINNSILNCRNLDFKALESIFKLKKRNKDQPLEKVHYDIAASMQFVTNKILLNLVKLAEKLTYSKNLCLAGGVALNCVANAYILENTNFDNIYIQPTAHDGGTSLGAALVIWHEILKEKQRTVLSHTYLGPSFSENEIIQILDNNNLKYTFIKEIEKEVALLISSGSIVGWFQGAMEFGPRALGNRSLLGDPRNPNLRDIMNSKVKHREPFRPFAPSILLEEVDKWFVIPKYSPALNYMLFSFSAKDEIKHLIPAVLHVDGTGRLQTVTKESNEKYYLLIKEFFNLTGVPILLNTSFNDDEPIVCTPQDAILTFKKTNIDYLVLGNILIAR